MAPTGTSARAGVSSLWDSVLTIPGVSDKTAPRLERLGITTVRDLLFHLPRRYEDTRALTPVSQLRPGEVQTARVVVRSVKAHKSKLKKVWVVEASLAEGRDEVGAVWFNQPFIASKLTAGMEILVSGKVQVERNGDLVFRSPEYEFVGRDQRHVGRLAAVYPETDGVSSKQLRAWIETVLATTAGAVPDRLPPSIRAAEQLMPIDVALRQVHRPDDEDSQARAHERIAFEQLFLMQLAGQRARRRRLHGAGVVIPYDVEVARSFTASLPFTLTAGQRVAAHEVLTDMAASGSMNRLLQGDVGSGKTVVAAMAAVMARHGGVQTAVMAPTEILARQHHATLTALLAPHDIAPRLLVGSTPARARREILEAMAGGLEPLLVGTHALIEDDVAFSNLGLVVVDEQHRFGVAQRQRLRRKGALTPNFLAMTATPIPRSLQLTVYGDVNVSELREMPPGRQQVVTRVVPPDQRDDAYTFIGEQVQQGRQAFVICPLIEENDKLGVRSATVEFERLRDKVFPDLRIELLHGRMAAREKDERMTRFARGEADLLVATSVVEVGVDVPNATIMVVEGAERFGLAQLHQLRGRVGRGAHRSYCMLFEGGIDDEGSQRLALVASTNDGFELAELDLRMRGSGDVAGLRQHGLTEMWASDLLNAALMQRARRAAEQWLDRDPELTEYPPLHEAMNGYRAVFDLD